MIRKLSKVFIVILSVVTLYSGYYFLSFPRYEFVEKSTPLSFEEFFQKKQEISKKLNVKPQTEEKFINFNKSTKYVILYIHGFGASRQEGEFVVDKISKKLQANTYYLRLPGHGTNMEEHANTTYRQYLDEIEESFRAIKKLGSHLIVIGTSMGGLLATHLGIHHSDEIFALILCSPFYDFSNKSARLLYYPGTFPILKILHGEIRVSPVDGDGSENFWYYTQYNRALLNLVDLTKVVVKKSNFEKITTPTLLLYYYKNEENQDPTANVSAMLNSFQYFKNTKNKAVSIEEGNHVLLSKYRKSDYEKAETEILNFIESL